jgi:hypothetical protein
MLKESLMGLFWHYRVLVVDLNQERVYSAGEKVFPAV